MKRRIRVVEVGPRDGLQNEQNFKRLPEQELVDSRVRFIIGLADSGLKDVEAGAFVRADRVPQMVATDKVIAAIRQERPDLWQNRRFWTLVPNERGLEDALKAGVKHISVFTATSDTFNQRNLNMSVQESMAGIKIVVAKARKAKLKVRGYISTVWGCPYEGRTSPKRALSLAKQLLDWGVEEVSLGDTIGVATPDQVRAVLTLFRRTSPIAVHFHDTRGTAIANCLEALRAGITTLDAAAGGLGGCPYAKGASGNVATEDLLYMLAGMRFTTGVDLDKVCAATETLAHSWELALPSRYHRAWLAARSEAKARS